MFQLSHSTRARTVSEAKRRLRLLCATDLSAGGNRAMQRASLLADQLDAELRSFHSADAADKVSAIAEAAREWDADLIVIGSHTTRFGDSVIGTTAERVSRKARRPILVVNRDVARPYGHVLLTSDLSMNSAEAANVAEELGLLAGTTTAVIHSLSPAGRSMLRMSGVSEPAIQTYVQSMSQSASREILQQLDQAGLRTEKLSVLARQASPVKAIEHAAQLMDADLVVVGASHFPMLKRIVLGSTSNEVLRRLRCDVLLVSPGAINNAGARVRYFDA